MTISNDGASEGDIVFMVSPLLGIDFVECGLVDELFGFVNQLADIDQRGPD